jgi:hypothetical protein
MFNNSVHTAQETLPVSGMKTSQLPAILNWGIIALYPEIRMEHVNTLRGQNFGYLNVKLDVALTNR